MILWFKSDNSPKNEIKQISLDFPLVSILNLKHLHEILNSLINKNNYLTAKIEGVSVADVFHEKFFQGITYGARKHGSGKNSDTFFF